jgi:2-amino-4-hydroxy-6-hydroxymethyldihydropteridine diphosphokinase
MTERNAARDYDALIGLGSNVGDKRANIARALDVLTEQGDIHVVRRSADYRSAPWGVAEQDWFVNACAAVATSLDAHQLLLRCLAVEDRLGRVRQQKWGPRLIDVDILTWREETIDLPDLKVPHPYIEQRGFVLVPLAEIASDAIIRGRPLQSLLQEVDAADVLPIRC